MYNLTLNFCTGRAENLDYWDFYIRNTSDTVDDTLQHLTPQYVVPHEDWKERLTKSKKKIEALKLDEFNGEFVKEIM